MAIVRNWLFCLVGVFSFVLRVEASTYCNATQACPQDKPCCSQFGECGTGQYCLNNCDVRYSFSQDSCMPVPICKSSSTKFNDYSSKMGNADVFLGNVSEADWLYSGRVLDYDDEESLILAMPKNSGGTIISSTRAVWYGKVSARIKTSHLAGVITAFILYSGAGDEIDYEFVGADLETVQTNYYWESVLNFTNSANISTTDTFDNFHTYEMDWHEDYVTWSIDNVVGRTLFKNETYNSTTNSYHYPQTPSKVDISIWPGGNSTNAPGTIAWSGGEINWDAPDISDPGYYYAIVNEINITCYDPPSSVKKNGTSAYIYTSSDEFLEKDIAITDDDVMMDTDGGSGLDPHKGATTSSVQKTSSSTSASSKSSSEASSSHSTSTKKGSKTTSASSSSTSSSSSSTKKGDKDISASTSLVSPSSSGAASSSTGSASSAGMGANVATNWGLTAVCVVLGYII
ncbi:putative glycosidase CRH2 [Saccharomyces pastorianus]|uniref:Crh-like protein n=1 Tax=Saccharomyces pastorianus TaxID=27292 RepID=A0A6C1E6D3_SACPS|nr:putative glycosidase CRH2 [Saccharomyces pastorianus]